MKSYIRQLLCLMTVLCVSSFLFAQLSDLHFLPPLKQRTGAFVEQAINLSTPETSAFSVNVYKGTSSTVIATLSVSKTSPSTYNPGNGDNNITLLTDANTGSVQSNSGLRFESSGGEKFYVNWRGKSASQASSLTSKGRAALGTAFKWVGVPNNGLSLDRISSSVGIMATEDNTTVNIFGYNPNCTFRLGASEGGITADEITITLNKGQTYVLESIPNNNIANKSGWIGASINANKAIAVNIGQMHFQPIAHTSQDCAIDQIIPENTLGKDFIFVRGNGVDNFEFPVIIATQNDTKIYVNGGTSPIATINNGNHYMIPSTYYSQSSTSTSMPGANMFVRTSKEAYAVQSLAGSTTEATGDLNFIAPVSCLMTNTVDNIPNIANIAGITMTGGITIIASSAISESNITVTYGSNTVSTSTLTSAKRSVTGTSEWNTYYLSGLTGDVSVSATGPIAVGFFGYNGNAGASGYFSGFESIPTIEVQTVGDGCLPGTILNATPGFTAYSWYNDGILVPGVRTNSYTPNLAGKFTVTVSNGSCSYNSANQYIYDCNPEIVVNTTSNKSSILSGEAVTFQISVRFLGDANVNNLILTNLMPSNVTISGTSATFGTVNNSGSTYTWTIGTMRNGEEHLLEIYAVGITVTSPTPGTLTVSKTQTFERGTESNKIPDDFSETITVYPAIATEPTASPTGLYFTNTGSAHPYNNVLHFTAASDADGYMVIRNTGTEPSFIPVDGNSYSIGAVSGGEIIYYGNLTSVTDLSANPTVNYHYTIYSYNGGGAASNYRTTNPLKAVINNRSGNNYFMEAISKSSSSGLANDGVNVTFINGVISGGTTITATKTSGSRPVNYYNGLPSGLNSVRDLYYTVNSTASSPGQYVISLDFSEIALTESAWNDAKVLKRTNASSNWEDITSKVITRKSDGLLGKLIITNLNSFSEFAIGSTETVLPLTWLDFSATAIDASVKLRWQTVNESTTKDFIVQHSNNGVAWNEVGNITAAGNSNSIRTYGFTHNDPINGDNFYRLKQRDLDGNFSFSKIKKVRFAIKDGTISLLGNPVKDGILHLNTVNASMVLIKGMDGKLMKSAQLVPGKNQINIHHLSAGTYLLITENDILRFIKK
jgi:uncharacterized repeat protein (TIGR01451 family)